MKINWKKIIVILILLLFIGTMLAIAFGDLNGINVLQKTP